MLRESVSMGAFFKRQEEKRKGLKVLCCDKDYKYTNSTSTLCTRNKGYQKQATSNAYLDQNAAAIQTTAYGPTKVLIGMVVIDMAVMDTVGITMEAIIGVIKLFEQAKEAKEELRKQHAECKGISLERRALIDKCLDDEAWNDYEAKKTLDKVDVALSGGFGLAIHGARESEMGEKVK
ncbi:hypothetical protein Tco_1207920, partial [Tanacetum coccineum]